MRQCKMTYTFHFDCTEGEVMCDIVAAAMREAADMIDDKDGRLSDDVHGSKQVGRVLVSYEANYRNIA